MSESLLFAGFALMVAGISPLLLGYFTHRARLGDLERSDTRRKADMAADAAHRNEIAVQAAEVAEKLMASNQQAADNAARVAAELIESNKDVAREAAAVADRTERGLNQIHAMVDGSLTRSMEAERAASEQALGAITETINMKLEMGQDVLPETMAAQAKLDEQLEALNKSIADRHATMKDIRDGKIARHIR